MRKVIKIDESLCNGCGECITACAEGAIELKDGKARVISDSFCDGLGACLAVCPQSALTIEEREAEAFDENAAKEHLGGFGAERAGRAGLAGRDGRSGGTGQAETTGAAGPGEGSACFSSVAVTPCTAPITLKTIAGPGRMGGHGRMEGQMEGRMGRGGGGGMEERHKIVKTGEPGENELVGWPIQMSLVRPWAPYLKGASLLVAGDCTAFAYPDIQKDFIRGRALLVGCPKLDDTGPFVEKLVEILKANEILDITVLHMTVPCCAQLNGLVAEAVKRSGKDVSQKSYVVGIDGKLQTES